MRPAQVSLIVTHPDPDWDVVGLVYSARKALGATIPVEFRDPTPAELEAPRVLVGDVPLAGAEALGNRPDLNNFDHHGNDAEHCATWLFNRAYPVLRPDLVAYIEELDLGRGSPTSEPCFKLAMVGIRVLHAGHDPAILAAGCQLLAWIEATGQNPSRFSGALPGAVAGYVQTGLDELRRIRELMGRMRRSVTRHGRSVGSLVARAPLFSIAKEEMLALGIDLAVVHDPWKKRSSVKSNRRSSIPADFRDVGLAAALNAAEHMRGLPENQLWRGHEDRIASPKGGGSTLALEDVLAIVEELL